MSKMETAAGVALPTAANHQSNKPGPSYPRPAQKTTKNDDEIELPRDPDAERIAIGCILRDNLAAEAVELGLVPGDFLSDRCRAIYRTVLDLHDEGKPADPLLVVDRLKGAGERTDLSAIAEMTTGISRANFAEAAGLVIANARKRETLRLVQQVESAIADGAPAGDLANILRHGVDLMTSGPGLADPRPIPDDLAPVPTLPIALMPGALRGWVHDIAERLQVPLEFPAVPAIIAAGAVIGNHVRLHPKRRDDWFVIPNLWGAVIGRPGVMKSPAIEQALRPLNMLIKAAEKEHEEACKAWLFDAETAEQRRAVAKEQMKKALRKNPQANLDQFRDDIEAEIPAAPAERRYRVNDATIEKYGELLNQNPRGLLVFRDELTGWLRSLDDERRTNDRAFFLEAWDGQEPYVYDRIGRGTLKIESMTTSILGGIQPAPLSQYLRGALGMAEGDDGLMQRFQLAVYPDLPAEFRNVDRWPDSEAKRAAFALYDRLDKMEREASARRFDEGAQELFYEWYVTLQRDLRAGEIEHPALESHFSKYPSLFSKLALIFHLCGADDHTSPVTLEAAEMAAAWCEFLRAHALRIYGLGTAAAARNARTLARRLQAGDLPAKGDAFFTVRQIYLKGWAGLSDPKSAQSAIDLLVELAWVQAKEIPPAIQGGRPTVHYYVNPKIYGPGRRAANA